MKAAVAYNPVDDEHALIMRQFAKALVKAGHACDVGAETVTIDGVELPFTIETTDRWGHAARNVVLSAGAIRRECWVRKNGKMDVDDAIGAAARQRDWLIEIRANNAVRAVADEMAARYGIPKNDSSFKFAPVAIGGIYEGRTRLCINVQLGPDALRTIFAALEAAGVVKAKEGA